MQQQLASNSLLQGGKYKIISVLGQGSFGITYLAEHTSLNRKVAIKEFFMNQLNTRNDDGSVTGMSENSLPYNYAQKFRKEAANLAQMEHPNIVRVTDSFQENGTYYYVMNYIDGANLNDYIKSHKMSIDESIAVIKDVSKALEYMHDEKHMLHLDLKPGNIMRRNDGHIFLIDFGLSKHYDSAGAPETSTTIGLGTAGYAPIEQANQAKNGEFRPSIDVYALGATFYKLLTGKTPPAASDLVSDDELIANELKACGIPKETAKVVIDAMMPNVKKRTQNVHSFLDGLSQNAAKEKKVTVTASNTTENDEMTLTTAETVNERVKFPKFAKIGMGVMLFLYAVMTVILFIFTLEEYECYQVSKNNDSYSWVCVYEQEYYILATYTVGAILAGVLLALVCAKRKKWLFYSYIAAVVISIFVAILMSSYDIFGVRKFSGFSTLWAGSFYPLGVMLVTLAVAFVKIKGVSVYRLLK